MNNINDEPSIINIDSLPEVTAQMRRPRSDHLFRMMKNEIMPKSEDVRKSIPVTIPVPMPSVSSGSQIEIRNGQLNDPSGSIRYLDQTKSRLLNYQIVENQKVASLTKEEKARKLQASIHSDESALQQLQQKRMQLKNEAKKACFTYSAIDNSNRKHAPHSKPSQKHLLSFKMSSLTKKAKRSTADGIGKMASGHQLLSKDPQWLTRALSSNNDSSSDSSRGNSRSSCEFPKDDDNKDIDSLLTWNSLKTIGRLPNSGLIFDMKNEFSMNEINTLAMTKLNAVFNEKIDKSTEYLPRMKPERLPCGHNYLTDCFDSITNRITNSNLKLSINGRLPHEYFSNEFKECIGTLILSKNNNCHSVSYADIMQSLNNSQMECRIKETNQFDWTRFVNYYKSKRPHMKLAPADLFVNSINKIPINTIEIGQKLEAIDPIHNTFCVCSVVEKCGMRLKLHFDGYSSMYDFWMNDTNAIFPPGFCDKTGRVLEQPGPMTSSRTPFDWKEYLKRTKSSPAHGACFPHLENRRVKNTNKNPFKKDMKFEAELRNSGKICVATVGDVLDSRILVKFDNYEETHNYWTDITSPYIHPDGWHAECGFPIQTAPDKTHKVLYWNDYLRKTRSEAVPESAFCMRKPYLFEAGMVLEAVDKKNPNLIRPAIITEVKDYEIKILYIGWPERYAYWIRDDSNEIFPPGYCRRTNHPIECPLDEVYAGFGLKSNCVQGCRGMGNSKNPNKFNHASIDECPYEDKHFRMDHSKLLPNRLERKPRINTPINNGIRYVPRQKQLMNQENAQLSLLPALNPVELAAMAPKDVELYRRLQVSANFLMDNLSSMSEVHQRWMQNLEPSKSMKISIAAENPLQWSVEKVAEFVSDLPNCSEIGAIFEEHEIDGLALLSLRQDDMIDVMGLSLGAAIKIFNRICFLREECNAKYIQYE